MIIFSFTFTYICKILHELKESMYVWRTRQWKWTCISLNIFLNDFLWNEHRYNTYISKYTTLLVRIWRYFLRGNVPCQISNFLWASKIESGKEEIKINNHPFHGVLIKCKFAGHLHKVLTLINSLLTYWFIPDFNTFFCKDNIIIIV